MCCESSQELSTAQGVSEMQQALAEAEFQSVITGVVTTGQGKLLRILQWIINIFISALRAAVKSLLSCKQPKTGVCNELQSVSFLCSVVTVSVACHGDLREDGFEKEVFSQIILPKLLVSRLKFLASWPVPCSELTQREVKHWNTSAP